MRIYLNHKEIVVREGFNVAELMENEQLSERKGIALAVNQVMVPKSDWEGYQLMEEDKITVITATQGG